MRERRETGKQVDRETSRQGNTGNEGNEGNEGNPQTSPERQLPGKVDVSTCLLAYLPTCLLVYLSTCLPVSLSTYFPVYLSTLLKLALLGLRASGSPIIKLALDFIDDRLRASVIDLSNQVWGCLVIGHKTIGDRGSQFC